MSANYKRTVLARFAKAGAQFLKGIPDAPTQAGRDGYWRIYQSVDQTLDTPNLGTGATEDDAWEDAATWLARGIAG